MGKMAARRQDGRLLTLAAHGGTDSASRFGDAPLRLLIVLSLLLSGCATHRADVERNLMADRHSSSRGDGVADFYRVGCPEVLEIIVDGRPDVGGRCALELNGTISLAPYGTARVEGRTPKEIATLVAEQIGAVPGDVHVRVAEYRSQHLYLFGEVIGWQRAIPYQGQETVLDVLQRVGGITPGAEPDDVYVVRPHIADGQRPEVFHVNLAGIVMKRDFKTNLRLQP